MSQIIHILKRFLLELGGRESCFKKNAELLMAYFLKGLVQSCRFQKIYHKVL